MSREIGTRLGPTSGCCERLTAAAEPERYTARNGDIWAIPDSRAYDQNGT